MKGAPPGIKHGEWFSKRNQQQADLQSYGSFDGRFGDIIALASMTYIVDLNAYVLHMGDSKVFNNFINER